MSSNESEKSASNAINPGPTRTRLVKCPYKVLLGGVIVDEFYDIRDAIASTHVLKTSHLNQLVKVTNEPSGRLIVEI
jgi:hypothetical protein